MKQSFVKGVQPSDPGKKESSLAEWIQCKKGHCEINSNKSRQRGRPRATCTHALGNTGFIRHPASLTFGTYINCHRKVGVSGDVGGRSRNPPAPGRPGAEWELGRCGWSSYQPSRRLPRHLARRRRSTIEQFDWLPPRVSVLSFVPRVTATVLLFRLLLAAIRPVARVNLVTRSRLKAFLH